MVHIFHKIPDHDQIRIGIRMRCSFQSGNLGKKSDWSCIMIARMPTYVHYRHVPLQYIVRYRECALRNGRLFDAFCGKKDSFVVQTKNITVSVCMMGKSVSVIPLIS